MANIRVDLASPVINGQTVTFKSPVDCSEVTGLKVYYPIGNSETSVSFQFADAHGNNVGHIDDLFTENVLVKVILDTESNKAYVQNADTNAYLEGRFDEKLSHSGGQMTGSITLDKVVLKRGTNYGTEEEMRNLKNPTTGQLFFILA